MDLIRKSNEELFELFKGGLKEAFGIIFLKNRHLLWRDAMKFVRNVSDADDVVQDTMTCVLEKKKHFTGGNFLAWVFVILRNQALLFFRKSKRHPKSFDHWKFWSFEQPENEEDIEESLDRAQLKIVLSQLHPHQRQAIELVRIHEMTYRDAARKQGVSMGTLQGRIRIGLERARKVYESLKDPDNGPINFPPRSRRQDITRAMVKEQMSAFGKKTQVVLREVCFGSSYVEGVRNAARQLGLSEGTIRVQYLGPALRIIRKTYHLKDSTEPAT